jgi:hypothetical protein
LIENAVLTALAFSIASSTVFGIADCTGTINSALNPSMNS